MNAQKFPLLPVLIVDDEEDILQSYKMTLRLNKINNLSLCSDSRQVPDMLAQTAYSTIILDLFMPHVGGQELLDTICEKYPQIPVIVVTGSNNVTTAVECMKLGAFDYMVKPVEDSRLVSGLMNAIELGELRHENSALKKRVLGGKLESPGAFSKIVSVSDSIGSIFKYIEAIASSSKPVLVTGESGTGKELFTRAIHDVSGRAGKFIAINVAGLDDTVFSDTLFGHKKGAFTGADEQRGGLVEQALGGTLFLDEIGSLELSSQTKLLRLLQEGEYYPLGSDLCKTANIAVIAATNDDLSSRIKEGKFRSDLFFRLKIHHIHIPPLRDRREDICALSDHFAAIAARDLGKKAPTITSGILLALNRYHFPGNVRELQSLIFDTVSRSSEETLNESYVKEYCAKASDQPMEQERTGNGAPVSYTGEIPKLKDVEEYLITQAVKIAEGNQTIAAQFLGISQSTLSRRLKKDS
jgi:DNA-binding NtrC family response regulator